MKTPIREVYEDLYSEYGRAKRKHGENTMDGVNATDLLRILALVEEVGEVAKQLIEAPDDHERLYEELLHVANVATTWCTALDLPS